MPLLMFPDTVQFVRNMIPVWPPLKIPPPAFPDTVVFVRVASPLLLNANRAIPRHRAVRQRQASATADAAAQTVHAIL